MSKGFLAETSRKRAGLGIEAKARALVSWPRQFEAMERSKQISGIVIGSIVGIANAAVALRALLDGRPTRMNASRFGYVPQEVSAARLAAGAGILAVASLLLVSLLAFDLVKEMRIDRMSKRIMRGVCPYCEFELGDSTGTATCPECGKQNSMPVKRKK